MVWRAAVDGEARMVFVVGFRVGWRLALARAFGLFRAAPVYTPCGRAGEALGLGRWPLGSETVLDPFSKRSTRQLIDFTAQPNLGCVLVPYNPLAEKL